MRPWALVALNMGGPDKPEAIEPFLRNLLSDPAIVQLPFPMSLFQKPFARFAARRRAAHAKHGYDDLGGSSPLLRHTQAQAEGIARELSALGLEVRPFVGMRYWHPFADEAAKAIKALDPQGTIVVSLYPQYSPATGGSSLDDMQRALEAAGLTDRPVLTLDRFPVLPGYVHATVASVRRGLETMGGAAPHVLFSAHGLPRKYIDRGDPYLGEIKQTYDAVREDLPRNLDCSLAFQSRVGPAEWLRPYVEDHVPDLARRGVRRVLMVPLGFVSDHIETLHEMDETYAGLARSLGMEFHRTPALNDDAVFCKAVAGACHALHERWQSKAKSWRSPAPS